MIKHGNGYKFDKRGGMYPETLCQVVDGHTGEVIRFTETRGSFGSEEEAVLYVESRKGWQERLIAIRVSALVFTDDL